MKMFDGKRKLFSALIMLMVVSWLPTICLHFEHDRYGHRLRGL